MRRVFEFLARFGPLVMVWLAWWWALEAPISSAANLAIIAGGVLLSFPMVWLGRRFLDRHQAEREVAWTTECVHIALGFLWGVPLVRAVTTYQDWRGWLLPVPPGIGLALVLVSGAAFLLCVLNLALKGLGAPMYIALSQKLAVGWLYAWTRNPMVLAALALLASLGVWFRSALFLLWALVLYAPALLFFIIVYEEKELELRFREDYLAYKSRTPRLWPRKPGGGTGRPEEERR